MKIALTPNKIYEVTYICGHTAYTSCLPLYVGQVRECPVCVNKPNTNPYVEVFTIEYANKPLNASKGDTAPQNYVTFITPIGGGTWEKMYVFETRPTNQDVCNAIVQDGKSPLLYTWQTNSLS